MFASSPGLGVVDDFDTFHFLHFPGTRSTSKHCSATISTTTSSTSTTTRTSAGSGFTVEAFPEFIKRIWQRIIRSSDLKSKNMAHISAIKFQSQSPSGPSLQIHIFVFALCLAGLKFARLSNFRADFFFSDFSRQVRTRNAVKEKLLFPLQILRRCALHRLCLQYHVLPVHKGV